MRFQPAAYGLALLFPGVVIPFQLPPILQHSAWAHGYWTVQGNVDKFISGMKTSEVDYSYDFKGRHYKGNIGGVVHTEGPRTVYVAKDNPAVSELDAGDIGGRYVTAFVLVVISLIPVGIMLGLEVARVLAKKRSSS